MISRSYIYNRGKCTYVRCVFVVALEVLIRPSGQLFAMGLSYMTPLF